MHSLKNEKIELSHHAFRSDSASAEGVERWPSIEVDKEKNRIESAARYVSPMTFEQRAGFRLRARATAVGDEAG